ncbi:MAG: hypothetical protein FJW23_10710 [Acidimicrobiia bacterium]|nr:hypothetical protein [Acidimicrobiia bacterium]
MPLDRYREKRNFDESPEPAGRPGRRSPGGRAPRFFCVQKHLASHLHYDLRLEHDGVLLSWAVPKGPSLDPATKRLAMHVEDHPVEYGDFEGVIPSGYGAGVVMLWDRGTWTPEGEDVDAALAKGDLKFTLDGYKLKGSWVLVRTKGGPGGKEGRSWLLIKHRDQWSGGLDSEWEPFGTSVKSRRDFADILAENHPDTWDSGRPAARGDANTLFRRIIAQAMAMRAGKAKEAKAGTRRAVKKASAARGQTARRTRATKGTKGTKAATTKARRAR